MITLKEMGIMDIDGVKKALKAGFETALGIRTYHGVLTENEINTADQLLVKYQDHDWIYRMDIKRSRKTSSLHLPQ